MTPTTGAGRALLGALDNLPVHSARNWTALGMGDNLFFYVAAINVLTTPDAIAAIEAEARAAAIAEVRALLRRWESDRWEDAVWGEAYFQLEEALDTIEGSHS